MNFYNPFLPFLSLQTMHNNTLETPLPNQNSFGFHPNLMVAAPSSLNKKRSLNPQSGINLDNDDIMAWEPIKKVKPNENIGNLNVLNLMMGNQTNRENLFINNLGFGYNKTEKEIIDLEAKDPCLTLENFINNSTDKPSSVFNPYIFNTFNSNSFPNISNKRNLSSPLAQHESILQNFNLLEGPSTEGLLLLELYKQTQLSHLFQHLNHKDQVLSQLVSLNPIQQIDKFPNQLNLLQVSQQELIKNTSIKKKEIIVIDEEDSTCQTTPQSKQGNSKQIEFDPNFKKNQEKEFLPFIKSETNTGWSRINHDTSKNFEEIKFKQKTLATKLNNLLDNEIEKEIFESMIATESTCTPQSNGVPNKNDIYADIPHFELTDIREERKIRKPKLIWNPNSADAETLRKGFDPIKKIVGIEITDEIKVIGALKEYNMNLEITYEKIKRNKAFYKSHFRVQRTLRSVNLLH